jgi:uncharacterized membrane protein YhaH (DUF805 family)
MSFVSAIQSGFRNYANFKGRATRSEYWWWALFTLIVQIVTSGAGDAIGGVVSLGILVPSIAVAIRRMHDTNHRGWWQLFPIVNLVFALRAGDAGENRFGPPPPPRSLS